jgi:hypothetical protein
MILVDTNLLSAIMRVSVEPAVERWFDAQLPESVYENHNLRNPFRPGVSGVRPPARSIR